MQSWQWIHDHTSRPRMNLRGSIQRVDPDEKLGCFGNQIYDPRVTYQRLIYYHLRLYISHSVITIDALLPKQLGSLKTTLLSFKIIST